MSHSISLNEFVVVHFVLILEGNSILQILKNFAIAFYLIIQF